MTRCQFAKFLKKRVNFNCICSEKIIEVGEKLEKLKSGKVSTWQWTGNVFSIQAIKHSTIEHSFIWTNIHSFIRYLDNYSLFGVALKMSLKIERKKWGKSKKAPKKERGVERGGLCGTSCHEANDNSRCYWKTVSPLFLFHCSRLLFLSFSLSAPIAGVSVNCRRLATNCARHTKAKSPLPSIFPFPITIPFVWSSCFNCSHCTALFIDFQWDTWQRKPLFPFFPPLPNSLQGHNLVNIQLIWLGQHLNLSCEAYQIANLG